ncbi:MAG: CopD family protein [Limnochordaceae bacterium]|nr:CopD family protein [Limnochordaceae bacterium]
MGITRLPARPLRQVAWVCLALVLIVTIGLTGHPSARLDLMLAHAAHLAGVSTWGGTLLALAWFPGWKRGPEAKPGSEGERPFDASRMVEPVRRLSAMAGVVFPVLVIAGIYLGAALTGRRGDLLGSGYGRWLGLKVLVVVLVAAAAAINRWRLLPLAGAATEPDGPAAVPAALWRLRRSVRVEATLLVAVLALTAFLSTQSPPGLTGG